MNISTTDIDTLRAAIQQYQMAVRNRDEEERARQEAARLQREENMKAVGSFFKGIFALAAVAFVVYVLFQIDWDAALESIKVILGGIVLVGGFFAWIFFGMIERGASTAGAVFAAIFVIVLFFIVPIYLAAR